MRTAVNIKNIRIYFLMLAVLLMGLDACGKKAPPIPPTDVNPPMVQGVQVIQDNHRATLQWPVPEWQGKEDNAPAGFYVYAAKVSLSGLECQNCPVNYRKTADVRLERNQIQGEYLEFLEKGFRYFFKVSAYTLKGREGEKSAAVIVDY